MNLRHLYTRIIGIFFLLITISLVTDLVARGFTAESMHKIFHILIGVMILFHWNHRPFLSNFPLINGLFFSYIALFGLLFPNFANLDAFNALDTTLHAIVGLSGIAIALAYRK